MNKIIRRSMRKFLKHYGAQDTRKMIKLFSIAYRTTKQRIAGNLRALEYNYQTIRITTHIPKVYSTMILK